MLTAFADPAQAQGWSEFFDDDDEDGDADAPDPRVVIRGLLDGILDRQVAPLRSHDRRPGRMTVRGGRFVLHQVPSRSWRLPSFRGRVPVPAGPIAQDAAQMTLASFMRRMSASP